MSKETGYECIPPMDDLTKAAAIMDAAECRSSMMLTNEGVVTLNKEQNQSIGELFRVGARNKAEGVGV